MKIYRGKTQKILILCIMAIVVLGFSIGFSAFSSSLVIKSNLDVNPDSATFGVVFSSSSTSLSTSDVVPTLTPNTITASNAKIVNSSIPTISNFLMEFQEPGDKAQYVFYARNTGEYDAYLTSIIFNNASGGSSNKVCTPIEGTLESDITSVCNNIKLTVQIGNETYTKTEQISSHKLVKGSSEQVIVTVEFVNDGTTYEDSVGDFIVKFGDISLFYSSQDNGTSSIVSNEISEEGKIITLYGKTLVENYQIYGSNSGVGNLDSSSGKYIVPISVEGKNLFDKNKYVGAIGEVELNGKTCLQVYERGISYYELPGDSSVSYTLHMVIYRNSDFEKGTNLKANQPDGTQRHVTSWNTLGESRTAVVYGGETLLFLGWNRDDICIDLNLTQLELGTVATSFEPFFEPNYYNIVLSEPLMTGEYIDYSEQAVIASDGSIKERIEVPKLQINNSGTSRITINTINSPSNIKLIYY